MDFDALLKEAEAVQAAPPSAPRAPPAPEPPSMMDQLLAKVPTGLVNNPVMTAIRGEVMGAADPVVGTGQLIANALPGDVGSKVNAAISEKNKEYQQERQSYGMTGVDPARLAGNFVSPANLALALRAAPAVGMGARAIQGVKFGIAGGLSAPVDTSDTSGNYWMPKVGQTGAGAIAGGILGPLVGVIGDKVASLVNKVGFNPADASTQTDKILKDALAETGQSMEDVPAAQLDQVRSQVMDALSSGKQLDAAAALRKADFDAEGITPTLGQITRDPMQWAQEQNIKGVLGAGRPLTEAVEQGNKAVMQGIQQYGAGAQEPYRASPTIADALRNYDTAKAGDVSQAYATARASAGKDLPIPSAPLKDAFGQVMADFEDKVPKAIQTKFGAMGDSFTFGDADQLRKTINAHVGTDPPTNKALGILRSALDNAQSSVSAEGGPFAPAVNLAAQRFTQHEEVPALAAAANGPVDDKFVQKYVINNPSSDQVQKLADILRQQDPQAFQQAKAQIGQSLAQKAFGANAAGSKLVNQESYNQALQSLGTGKLSAFFDPNEIEQLKRLGRIGAYQVQPPAGSAGNFSNTASALANLVRSLGGHNIPIYSGAMRFGADKIINNASVNPSVPMTANVTPEQRLILARILAGGSLGAGVAQKP